MFYEYHMINDVKYDTFNVHFFKASSGYNTMSVTCFFSLPSFYQGQSLLELRFIFIPTK